MPYIDLHRRAFPLAGLAVWLALADDTIAFDTIAFDNGALETAAPPIVALAFAPAGRQVLVGSQRGLAVRNWPALDDAGPLATRLPHLTALAFSPDGQRLAAAGGTPGSAGMVEVWSWPGRELLQRKQVAAERLEALAWSHGGQWLAVAVADKQVLRLDGQLNTLARHVGHSRGAMAVAILPGDETLVTAGLDHSLRVWSVATGEARRVFDQHTAPVHALALRPAGEGPPLVASAGDDRTVRFWQPTIGRLVRFARFESPPLALAWSRDGAQLAAACADGRLRLVDPDTAAVTATRPALDGWAYALVAVPNAEAFLVGGERGQLRVVNLAAP